MLPSSCILCWIVYSLSWRPIGKRFVKARLARAYIAVSHRGLFLTLQDAPIVTLTENSLACGSVYEVDAPSLRIGCLRFSGNTAMMSLMMLVSSTSVEVICNFRLVLNIFAKYGLSFPSPKIFEAPCLQSNLYRSCSIRCNQSEMAFKILNENRGLLTHPPKGKKKILKKVVTEARQQPPNKYCVKLKLIRQRIRTGRPSKAAELEVWRRMLCA